MLAEILASNEGYYLGCFCSLANAQSYTCATAVFVDEFDAGHFQGAPILAADEWISDLQFFDYLSLLQVFRIENGTSCTQAAATIRAS